MDPYNFYINDFTFISEPENDFCVLPVDPNFFKYLWRNSTWGMTLYEQDWLGAVLMNMNATVDNVKLAHLWLKSMDEAALEMGISVMWDSPLASQILQSTEMKSAEQGSSMMDYNPGNSQWQNGYVNLLFWSVGLCPWKDSFWTSSPQTECQYPGGCEEPNTDLQTLVAVLTAGPVSIGDKIDSTNRTLLLRTCMDDGTILKPDKPLTPLDLVFKLSFDSLEDIQLLDTFTDFGGKRWHYVLAANISTPISVSIEDLELDNTTSY